jgi:fatty-acyl-CoA synthase
MDAATWWDSDCLSTLKRQAKARPDHPALVHYPTAEAQIPQTLTYGRAYQAACALAWTLRDRGVGTQDVVAVILPPVPEALIAIAAISAIAVVFPVNPLLTAEAIAAQMALAGVKAVVAYGPLAGSDLEPRTLAAIAATPSVRLLIDVTAGSAPAPAGVEHLAWAALEAGGPVEPALGERAAILLHTGGTTGSPKLAELGLAALSAGAALAAEAMNLGPGDRVFHLLPFFHVGGAVAVGLSLFSVGATLINCSPNGARDPQAIARFWALGARCEATVVGLVPASWSLVAAQDRPTLWPQLRGLATGAAAMPPELVQRLAALAGVAMHQVFGMTETAGIISAQPLDGLARDPAVGFSPPPIRTRFKPIGPNGPHELEVSGPVLFNGYRTAERLVDQPGEWLSTGDLAQLDGAGQISLAGRSKDVIIRGGHNIDPLMIEAVAARHPEVVMSAAVGRPDAFAGEVPVLFVVPRPGATLTPQALRDYVCARIDEPPARPRDVMFAPALPLTAVGKVARYVLRQQAAARCAEEILCGEPTLPDRAIDCTDVGARVIRVHWASAEDGEADALARRLLSPFNLSLESHWRN